MQFQENPAAAKSGHLRALPPPAWPLLTFSTFKSRESLPQAIQAADAFFSISDQKILYWTFQPDVHRFMIWRFQPYLHCSNVTYFLACRPFYDFDQLGVMTFSDACAVLTHVAKTFSDQGKPLQAIRCLQAAYSGLESEYPEQQAALHYMVGEFSTHNSARQTSFSLHICDSI